MMHCNRMSWWRNTVCWRRIVEARNLLKPFLLYSCVPCSLSSPHLVCLWKKHSGTDCLYSGKSWSTALLCWGSKGWHLQLGGKRDSRVGSKHFWLPFLARVLSTHCPTNFAKKCGFLMLVMNMKWTDMRCGCLYKHHMSNSNRRT